MSEANSNAVRRWLVNLVLVFVAGVLGFSMYFVWRLGRLTYSIQEAVVAISDDVKEVSGTAAQISGDVREIRQELGEVKERVSESVPVNELSSVVDAVLEVGESIKAGSVALDAQAEREIRYLLGALLLSKMKYDLRGEHRPISYLYATLWGKYRTLRGTLVSAEDFVERAATKSYLGRPYYIVDKEGNRRALKEWMLETLQAHRGLRDAPTPEAEVTGPDDESTADPW